MEFFNNANAVRLKSHLEKYLAADDDEETVRQSRSGASKKVRWTVERVDGNPHAIRLKSCHGRYLAASDESFLLGMTGKKVLQLLKRDGLTEWEPIKEGYRVKLRTKGGKFLRANGATPPWRNSITHDVPNRTSTQDWVMWDVDVVDVSVLDDQYLPSNVSSFSSVRDDYSSPNSPSFQSDSLPGTPLRRSSLAPDDNFSPNSPSIQSDSLPATRQRRSSLAPHDNFSPNSPSIQSDSLPATRQRRSSLAPDDNFSPNSPLIQSDSLPATRQRRSSLAADVSSSPNSPLIQSDSLPATPLRRSSLAADDNSSPNSALIQSDSLPATRLRRLSLAADDNSGPNSPSFQNDSRPTTPVERMWRSSLAAEQRWPFIGSDLSGREEGMEFFSKAKAVRLQSHLGKYLVADEDEATVRQSRNGTSQRARWTVEFVEGKRNRIRLKGSHGLYLTASHEPFLLGMTGNKVLQTQPEKKTDVAIEWEPIKEGLHVKLMTSDGKFLRANGGSPPWRNSVTHDVPHRTATQSWVLWGVEVVDIALADPDSGRLSPASIFSSIADDFAGSPETGSPMVQHNVKSGSMFKVSGMEFFNMAKTVRLKSYHNKYLTAESDEETVIQDRSGTCKSVRWTVEFVEGVENVLRLKSCYGKYLKATDTEFLLGVTGRKVVQSLPRKLDSSVEWEPVRDGMQVKLKTRYGNFLRANGGFPPWRNSITHDIPHRHHGWILWDVDVVEVRAESPPKVSRSESLDEDDVASASFNLRLPSRAGSGLWEDSTRRSEGRIIYYYVADDDGNFNDAIEEASFVFKGHGLEDLSMRLEEETGLEDIIVCSRNIVNGKLYPLRLSLPPNNANMHVVVVPPTSRVANDFLPPVT